MLPLMTGLANHVMQLVAIAVNSGIFMPSLPRICEFDLGTLL